ncbi:MAG: crossover junction endodeoxyribonuclease RuvC [Coriobacteriia bacterium]
MIILGIDPGLADTGWGFVEVTGNRLRCVDYGCVRTTPSESLPARLKAIHDALVALIAEHRPEECAVESVYLKGNARSALATGHARGAALLATAYAALPMEEYAPAAVKLAVVGNGAADKGQVAYMVRALLGLGSEPKPDHASDALAVAICHANSRVARNRVRAAAGGAR